MLIGVVADRLFGDPQRLHPVAGFGRAATELERHTYRDSKTAGVVHVVVLVGAAVGIGRLGAVPTAVATWAVLGGTTLTTTGDAMADHLERGDIDAARALLPSLCGRDPAALDSAGLARAALESIAENTSDAAVAPLFWGAVAGVPGLVGYRAINTLDAMIGYRNERYTRFGWAAAKLDDVANLVPARIAGALTVALADDRAGAIRAWRNDASKHPSPNAGVVEAATAGALGLRLGGRTDYPHGVELRPVLGDGEPPTPADLRRAVALSRNVQLASAALAVAVGHLVGRLRR